MQNYFQLVKINIILNNLKVVYKILIMAKGILELSIPYLNSIIKIEKIEVL